MNTNGTSRDYSQARRFAWLPVAPPRGPMKMARVWTRWTEGMSPRRGLLLAVIAGMTVLIGCGGLPRAYFHQDEYGRYYDTKSGQVLWVTPDGTVTDVTFLRHTLYHGARPSFGEQAEPLWIDKESKVVLLRPERLGRVRWTDGDWDLSEYDTAPETGMCRPPMAIILWPLDAPLNRYRYALESKRYSCLLLIRDTPVAVTESAILYGALLVDAAIHFPLVPVSVVVPLSNADPI